MGGWIHNKYGPKASLCFWMAFWAALFIAIPDDVYAEDVSFISRFLGLFLVIWFCCTVVTQKETDKNSSMGPDSWGSPGDM